MSLNKTVCFILAHLLYWNIAMADNGSHTEEFNGVNITFSPPNMAEQRSFMLRGALTKKETEILVPAIPAIAKFLNFLRLKDAIYLPYPVNTPRKPYQFIPEKEVWLAPIKSYGWRVSDDQISFVVEYIVNYGKIPNGDMGDYYFRDAYIFKKINGQWVFYDNFGDKPYGFLKCKHSDKSCKLDPPLW